MLKRATKPGAHGLMRARAALLPRPTHGAHSFTLALTLGLCVSLRLQLTFRSTVSKFRKDISDCRRGDARAVRTFTRVVRKFLSGFVGAEAGRNTLIVISEWNGTPKRLLGQKTYFWGNNDF